MVSFNRIPDNVRVPFFYAEFDNSQAGFFQINQKALMIGPMLGTGSATAGEPVLVPSLAEARALFGDGSALAAMVEKYRANDTFGELWALPVNDAGAGVPAEGSITLTGAATAAGTLTAYIAGRRVRVGVASGDDNEAVSEALIAAINADPFMQVVADEPEGTGGGQSVDGIVTLTAKHAGLIGNGIDIRLNYLGLAGGERTPDGLGVAIAPMAGGAGNADITAALAAIGDEEFDFVALAYSDAANLNAVRDAWDDVTGRWSWERQIYGHVFAGSAGAAADLLAFGGTRNDAAVTVIPITGPLEAPWEWAASWTAQAAVAVREDPARPFQSLPLVGIKAPAIPDRFTLTMRNSFLFGGLATWTVGDDGTVRIERSITTYQENPIGQSDPSYLDAQTRFTLMAIVRRLRFAITQKYSRHKLANDGTRFGAGQAVVTPSRIKAELVAQYSEMVAVGLVENIDAFKANLIVERDGQDPNRLNVLYAPDLINQLRVFAVLAQFRLQYAA